MAKHEYDLLVIGFGGHILAPRAGDFLAPIVVVIHANLPADLLVSTILPYPTMSEAVRWAAGS
jgi:pyruvate/2-oxoglutarate dehydrogenase complex dihydrolipoamide dehydrogenase (E3) component